jgi:hypothetical protein
MGAKERRHPPIISEESSIPRIFCVLPMHLLPTPRHKSTHATHESEHEMNSHTQQRRAQIITELTKETPGLGSDLYLTSPPPAIRKMAEAAFAEWSEQRQEIADLETIWATLSFDSNENLALSGTRSDVQSRRRQWVWHSNAAEVALDLWDGDLAPNTVSLSGQVLPGTSSNTVYRVHLLIEDVGVAITESDEFGEFQFDGLDRGDYFLALVSDELELIVGPIPVEGVIEGN